MLFKLGVITSGVEDTTDSTTAATSTSPWSSLSGEYERRQLLSYGMFACETDWGYTYGREVREDTIGLAIFS